MNRMGGQDMRKIVVVFSKKIFNLPTKVLIA